MYTVSPAPYQVSPATGSGDFYKQLWSSLGQAAPGLGGGIGQLLGAGAYGKLAGGLGNVTDYLKQLQEQATQGLQPYSQAGAGAIPQFQQYLQQFADPQAYISKVLGGYQASPEATQQIQAATKAAQQSAAASGLLGSSALQDRAQKIAQDYTAADQQRYLQNVLGVGQLYGGGLEQLMRGGETAAGEIGQLQTGIGQNIADYMAQQQALLAQQKAQRAGGWGQLLGGIATGLGSLFGL